MNLDKIKISPYNPRKITEDELNRLKASIHSHTEALENWKRDKGYRLVDPIVVNRHNGRLISGHQRVKALQLLEQDWIHDDDVRYVNIKNERKEMALNIVLNNPSAQGDFYTPLLKDVITEIDCGDFDLNDFTGFSQEELDKLFGESGNPGGAGGGSGDKEITCPNCNHTFTP